MHACLSDDVEEGAAECHADHVRCRMIPQNSAAQSSDPIKLSWKNQICTRHLKGAFPHFKYCEDHPPSGEWPNKQYPNACHTCDPSFCPEHGNCALMEIEHFDYAGQWETVPNKRDGTDNAFQAGAKQCANPEKGCVNPIDNAKFKCVQTGPNACKCHCNKHKPCCMKPGMRIQDTVGSELKGNTMRVDSAQACCNLCTNHPECKGWTYRTNMCELRNEVAMEQGYPDEIAGVRSGETC